MLRLTLPSLIVFCTLVVAGSRAAETPEASAVGIREAERMIFLLQYVGSDYAVAVKDGEVVDESEYRENQEFVFEIGATLAKIRSRLPEAKAATLEGLVRSLVDLVSSRADPTAVRRVTESAVPILLASFDLHPFPKNPPDPVRAAGIYRENCAICHGDGGRGDGPRAAELDPAPARFDDPERMASMAPYVFYNAVTLGIANTSMASFREAFTDQERWDLAFYLWTFVQPAPNGDDLPATFSLRDLATRSSANLVPDLLKQAAVRGRSVGPDAAARWIARLRASPMPLTDHQERLARLRLDLSRSVTLVEAGSFDEAADVVTTSYFKEFEPLEPELDLRDREIRRRFERGLIDFRSALRRNDRQAALTTAKSLQEAADAAAHALSEQATGSSWILFGPALLIAGVAAVWMATTRRRSIGKSVPLG
ncbi:MAG: c-type cytochrome [Candidatus Binatia bacterium]